MSIRSTIRVFLWTIPLLLTTLACQAATSLLPTDTSVQSQSPQSTLLPGSLEDPVGAYCPDILKDILSTASSAKSDVVASSESHLVTYSVNGDEIRNPAYSAVADDLKDEQADSATQETVWNYFTAIIPEKNRPFITEYSVLTDGKDNLLAAVAQTYDDPSKWVLEVDVADSKNYENLTFTLMHEFGHLLTLNADQVVPSLNVFNNPHNTEIYDQEAALCPNYFPGEGCSKSNSYINHFYQRFWTSIYDEWNQVDQEQDELAYYIKLNDFYSKHEDQFVSDYAATNAAEDIAESWAYFVFTPKPDGNTVAEQKILFFYEYPELVELRQEILNNLCNAFP